MQNMKIQKEYMLEVPACKLRPSVEVFFLGGGGEFLFKIIWNNWVIAVIESHISRLEVITLES